MVQRYLEIYERILAWETSQVEARPVPVVPSQGMRIA